MEGMDGPALQRLVERIAAGDITPDDGVRQLTRLPFADLGDALVDHHRHLRQGLPEAVYAPGKSIDQCVRIVGELLEHGSGPVILSRVSDDQRDVVNIQHPGGRVTGHTMVWRVATARSERVVVCSGGTADAPVVEECAATLTAHGFEPTVIIDIGVAGLHRVLSHHDTIVAADAVVVVAGMEGALASVVSGLTGAPVVAVPTSTGYGSSFEGVTALLSMLASCASGMTVVGIDNGFGAACAVARMMRTGALR